MLLHFSSYQKRQEWMPVNRRLGSRQPVPAVGTSKSDLPLSTSCSFPSNDVTSPVVQQFLVPISLRFVTYRIHSSWCPNALNCNSLLFSCFLAPSISPAVKLVDSAAGRCRRLQLNPQSFKSLAAPSSIFASIFLPIHPHLLQLLRTRALNLSCLYRVHNILKRQYRPDRHT